MTERPGHRLGQGPLSMVAVLRNAAGMFQQGRARVVSVALLLFGFPSLVAAVVETSVADMPAPPGIAVSVVILLAIAIAVVLRIFGPVMFAGFLDEAVGQEYLFGHRRSLGQVLRSLPWVRLLVADFIVTGLTSLGLALFLVPGVLVYMFFGLVGPVIVQERRKLFDGLRRTASISRTALLPIALLVLIPAAFELVIHEIAHDLAHSAWFGFQVLVEWLIAAFIGGAIGLVEVSLAAELMARNPTPESLSSRLLDDGQAPTVAGGA